MRLLRFFLWCLWIMELTSVLIKADDATNPESDDNATTIATETTTEPTTTTTTEEPTVITEATTTTTTEHPDPTKIRCDTNKECPEPLICLRNKGHCGCPGQGDLIYSPCRNRCQIRAGGKGCKKSGDCTDGAACWIPNTKKKCTRWRERRRWRKREFKKCLTKKFPTQCHCLKGRKLGVGGECRNDCTGGPEDIGKDGDSNDYDDDPDNYASSGDLYGSLPQSGMGQVIRNLLSILLTTIISIYIIK